MINHVYPQPEQDQLLLCNEALDLNSSRRKFMCLTLKHGLPGESEAKVRQLFQEAVALAPCIIFIGAPPNHSTSFP